MKAWLGLLLMYLGLFVGCKSWDVQTYDDPRFALGGVSSFAWHPGGPSVFGVLPQNQSVVEAALLATVESELAGKGWLMVEPASADVLVRYAVGAEDEIEVTHTGTTQIAGQTYEVPVASRRLRDGKLAIDLIDPATGRVIWRGVTGRTFDGVPSSDQAASGVTRAVRAVLSELP